MPLADPKERLKYERERQRKKYKTLHVKFPIDRSAEIDRKAANNDLSPSAYIRELIIRDLRNRGLIE